MMRISYSACYWILISVFAVLVLFSGCSSSGGGDDSSGGEDDSSEKTELDLPVEKKWIVVGDSGTIIRSADNGDNWAIVSNDATGDFLAVASDKQEIWVAVGRNGMAFRSTDDGKSWTSISTGTTDNLMSIASDEKGNWLIAGSNDFTYFSNDDGKTWSSKPVAPGPYFNTIANDGNGRWIVGGSHLNNMKAYYSDDNGDNWAVVTVTGGGADQAFSNLVYHDNIWYACTSDMAALNIGNIFSSSDNGQSWNFLLSIGSSKAMATDHNGNWVLYSYNFMGPGGNAVKSPDNWQTKTSVSMDENGTGIATDGDGKWIISSNSGVLMVSTDLGITWSSIDTSSGNHFRAIAFSQ